MNKRTEYEELHGPEGAYTHAQAQSRQHTPLPLSDYAALVKILREEHGIQVTRTDEVRVNGKDPKKFKLTTRSGVLGFHL